MKKKYFLFIVTILLGMIAPLSLAKGQTIDDFKQLEADKRALNAKLKMSNGIVAEKKKTIELLQKKIDSLLIVIEGFRAVGKSQSEVEDETKWDTITNDIKDPMFLEYLLRYCDMDNDGILTQWDAEHTYVIDIGRDKTLWDFFGVSHQITSIDGIERFVNLKRLVCSSNTISQIDLSKNALLETFIANGCGLQTLRLPKSANLTHFECSNNLLSTIDLKNNPNLQSLDVSKNNLAAIDISECTQLKMFNCSKNALMDLDVSGNIALQTLDCSNNQISILTFTKNTSLDCIDCSNNRLTEVDVRNGVVEIKFFDCRKNKDLEIVRFSSSCRIYSDKRDAKTSYE